MRIPFFSNSHAKEVVQPRLDLPHLAKWLSGDETAPQGHIAIYGGSGTGKSTIAEMLAKEMPGTRVLFTSGSVPGWRELGLRGTFTDASGHLEAAVALEDVLSNRVEGSLTITLPHFGMDAQVFAAFLGQTLPRALAGATTPRPCARLIFDDILPLLNEAVVEKLLTVARSRYTQVIDFELPFSKCQNVLRQHCRWTAKLERPDSLVILDNFAGVTRHYVPVTR